VHIGFGKGGKMKNNAREYNYKKVKFVL